MAGDLKQFVFDEKENVRRYNSNIDAIIKKYSHPIKNVDIVDLDNLNISTSKGLLRRQRPRYFGHTPLPYTKRQEESILHQDDTSFLSYSMSSAAGTSTSQYCSRQLNSSGGLLVPPDVARADDNGWFEKSMRTNRGLDTFSLAEQVDNTDDANEMLSLQKTMMTFIENDEGDPSDAETLSSASSNISDEWQDEVDMVDNEVNSDKSSDGDGTVRDRRGADSVDGQVVWSPQRHGKARGLWSGENEDHFTLVSSQQDSGVSDLHISQGKIRSSTGIEWMANPNCSLGQTANMRMLGADNRWREGKSGHKPKSDSCESTSIDVNQQFAEERHPKSTAHQQKSSKGLNTDGHSSIRNKWMDGTLGHRTFDKTNGVHETEKVALHFNHKIHEKGCNIDTYHTQSIEKQWNLRENSARRSMSMDRGKFRGSDEDYNMKQNERDLQRYQTKRRSETAEDSKVVMMVERDARNQGHSPTRVLGQYKGQTPYTSCKSFEDLFSKSVPSKPLVQNLKDLPRGELSASNISKDPLTSIEKVYRWLSPPSHPKVLGCQPHASARRKLQLVSGNSGTMWREDQLDSSNTEQRNEDISDQSEDSSDQMDTDMDITEFNAQIQQQKQHYRQIELQHRELNTQARQSTPHQQKVELHHRQSEPQRRPREHQQRKPVTQARQQIPNQQEVELQRRQLEPQRRQKELQQRELGTPHKELGTQRKPGQHQQPESVHRQFAESRQREHKPHHLQRERRDCQTEAECDQQLESRQQRQPERHHQQPESSPRQPERHHRQPESSSRQQGRFHQRPESQQQQERHVNLTDLQATWKSDLKFRSPKNQHQTHIPSQNRWEDETSRQMRTSKASESPWKNLYGTPTGRKIPQNSQNITPHRTDISNVNNNAWKSLNVTPTQNQFTSSGVTRSPLQDKNSSPLSSSPWKNKRYHPYSRKNPESPSAVFARLKLGLPSPSTSMGKFGQGSMNAMESQLSNMVKEPSMVTSSRQSRNDRQEPCYSMVRESLYDIEMKHAEKHSFGSNDKTVSPEKDKYCMQVVRTACRQDIDTSQEKLRTKRRSQSAGRSFSREKIESQRIVSSFTKGKELEKSPSCNLRRQKSYDIFDTFNKNEDHVKTKKTNQAQQQILLKGQRNDGDNVEDYHPNQMYREMDTSSPPQGQNLSHKGGQGNSHEQYISHASSQRGAHRGGIDRNPSPHHQYPMHASSQRGAHRGGIDRNPSPHHQYPMHASSQKETRNGHADRNYPPNEQYFTHAKSQQRTHRRDRDRNSPPQDQNATHANSQQRTHKGNRDRNSPPQDQNTTHANSQQRTHKGNRDRNSPPQDQNTTHANSQQRTHKGNRDRNSPPQDQNTTHGMSQKGTHWHHDGDMWQDASKDNSYPCPRFSTDYSMGRHEDRQVSQQGNKVRSPTKYVDVYSEHRPESPSVHHRSPGKRKLEGNGEKPRQRFLSPTRWRDVEQESENLDPVFSKQVCRNDSSDNPAVRSRVQEKPVQLSCNSSLIKISAKPKMVSPCRNTNSNVNQESRRKSGMTSKNSVVTNGSETFKQPKGDRSETFKQPKGAVISLRDKVLVNNQLYNSTPMKQTAPLVMNESLSTIHGPNSDDDSSDDMVMTVSPSSN